MRFVPALRFFRRGAAARNEPDPADLGTAFGLEACLDGGAISDYRDHTRHDTLESQRSGQESPLAWLSRRPA